MGVSVAISHDSCIGYVQYVPHIEALQNPEKVVWSKFIETKMMLPESCARSLAFFHWALPLARPMRSCAARNQLRFRCALSA